MSRLLSNLYRLKKAYLWARRPLTVGVRCAVMTQEGKFLLVRHTYRPGWYFPGGGVDKGETLEAAILREMWEEVGLTTNTRPALFHAYSSFREYRSDHVVLYRLDQFSLTPNPNREIAEFGFFSIDDLPEETTPATRQRLHELAGGAAPAEHW